MSFGKIAYLGRAAGMTAVVMSLCGCDGSSHTETQDDDTSDVRTSDVDTENVNPLSWPECIPSGAGSTEGPACNYPELPEDCYVTSPPNWSHDEVCVLPRHDSPGTLPDQTIQRILNGSTGRPELVLPCCDPAAVVWASQGSPEQYYAVVYDAETRQEVARVAFPYVEDYDPDMGVPPCRVTYSGDPAYMGCLFAALGEAESRHDACEDQGCECVTNGVTDAIAADCQ